MTEAACPGPAGRPGARTAGGVEAISTTRDLSENARPHFEHLQPSSRTPNHSCGYSLHPPPRGRPEVAVHPDRAGLCGSGRPAPERAPSLRVGASGPGASAVSAGPRRRGSLPAGRHGAPRCREGQSSGPSQLPGWHRVAQGADPGRRGLVLPTARTVGVHAIRPFADGCP